MLTDSQRTERQVAKRWRDMEDANIDPITGLVKDGGRVRALTMADTAPQLQRPGVTAMGAWAPRPVNSERGQRFCQPVREVADLEIADTVRTPSSRQARRLARQAAASSSATSSTDAARSSVDDARRLTEEMLARNGVTVDQNFGGNRPGFRFGDGGTDPGQAVKDSAYREMCDFVSNQWKSPAPAIVDPLVVKPVVAAVADAVLPRTMTAADSQKIKDEAWNTMVSELTSAWKS
jgi:hypothetical protein